MSVFDFTVQSISELAQNLAVKNIGTYVAGAGATAGLSMLLHYILNDNDSYDFQNHIDQAFYLSEMKDSFVTTDYFSERLQKIGFIVSGFFLIVFLLNILLFIQLSKLRNYKNNTFMSLEQRIEYSENVIESILKENESIDVEQLNFFKHEVEEQRNSFKDFILNKSIELERKISDAKNSCLEAKNTVQTDLRKAQSLNEKINDMDVNLSLINKMVEKTKADANQLDSNIAHFISTIDSKCKTLDKSINEKCDKMNNKMQNQDVSIAKCNTLLLQSKVLLESALVKFEDLMSIADSDSNMAKPSTETSRRIAECLKKAIDINEFFKNQDNNCSNDFEISAFVSQTEGFIQTDPQINSVNALLFELMARLKIVEENINKQNSRIDTNHTKMKRLQHTTSEKIIDLKIYTDEWITSWVSVIYGLFNSSFQHLKNQFYGIDCIEYTTIFDIANDKILQNSELLNKITNQTKQTCFKLIKEINLYIFGFYLVHKTGTVSELIEHCNKKIDNELDDLFTFLEKVVFQEDHKLPLTQQKDLAGTLFRYKHELSVDLKTDTQRFNLLVRENLEDFYLIHDTMKQISKEKELEKKIQTSNLVTENVIEVSDESDLFNSDNEQSYSSFHDTSLEDSSASLKPFILNCNRKTS